MAGRHGRAGGRSGKVVRNGGSLNVSFT